MQFVTGSNRDRLCPRGISGSRIVRGGIAFFWSPSSLPWLESIARRPWLVSHSQVQSSGIQVVNPEFAQIVRDARTCFLELAPSVSAASANNTYNCSLYEVAVFVKHAPADHSGSLQFEDQAVQLLPWRQGQNGTRIRRFSLAEGSIARDRRRLWIVSRRETRPFNFCPGDRVKTAPGSVGFLWPYCASTNPG